VHSRRADTYGHLPEKKRARRCCLEQTQFKVEAGAASMEVEAAATLLVGILSKRGIDATAKQLVELIKLGQQWAHFGDTQLLYSVSEWQELGETMWEKTILGEEKEEKEIKAVWGLLANSIRDFKGYKGGTRGSVCGSTDASS